MVSDNFLNKKHFDSIKNIEFDTKSNDWDIYKHKIYNDGKVEIGFQLVFHSSGKEGNI